MTRHILKSLAMGLICTVMACYMQDSLMGKAQAGENSLLLHKMPVTL